MKNTKSRIKEKARALFNEKGLTDTTLRNIAAAVGISQGNLNYHFRTKQDLIEVLYFELVELLNEKMGDLPQGETLLKQLFGATKITMTVLYEYRFFLRDLYKIFRENEKIKSHYTNLQQLRTQQFLQFFEVLVANELMRPEEFEGEYQNLYARMNILGDNWINAQELLQGNLESPVDYYALLLFEVFYPYFTPKGKEAFLTLKQEAS